MPDNLKIKVIDQLTGAAIAVDSSRLSFVGQEGKVMFEVNVLSDRRIEVRAVDTCRIDDGFRKAMLVVFPKVGNVVHLETTPYETP